MGASSSRSTVPRWNTLHERGRGKEEADVRGKEEEEENEDVEKGLCGCKKKKTTKYGSNHTNTTEKKKKKKKDQDENYDAIIGDENDEDRRRRSRYDGRSSQSVSSEDKDEVAKRLQYESTAKTIKKGTHGSKESSVKSSEKSSKKQLRKEKEQLAMNAKLYDLEKQEILATRKKLADEEELEKGRRMWLCSGSPWVSRVAVCVLLVLVVVLATILGTELHYYERGLAYFRGEEYLPPMAYDGGRSRRKKKNSRIDDEMEDEDDVELGEDEEDDEEDDSEFDENFDKDGGAGAALSVNEREIKMAKKLMQKVRNSKTLPKDRKQVELRGLNETLTNLQIERVELLNEFDDSDDAKSSSVAKVGLSGEMAKKIANKNKILENNDRDKTGAYYNANAPFRYPWGGTSPGTSHSDESSSLSKKGGLTEDVSEQDILRGQHFDADLRGNAMSREEVKLSVSDFIARLKEKEGVKGWSKNVRDTVASDDFAHRIARSMVNDVRGVSDDEDILWSHADDVALPENSDITEDDVLSRLELEKKLNAVEQSLAEEKGKDEWLARTAAKNSVDKFLNEADLRGRIESGEVDPEVLENLIEAVQQSEKSNIDTVNTVENDVMKKLHPAKKAKKKSSANKKNSDADDVQEEGEKPEASHPMSLDDLFDIPMDGLDTGDDDDDDDDNETRTKKSKKKSIISSKNRSTSSSSSSSKKNAKKSSGGDMKKAKKGKEEEKVDAAPSPPEDGKKGLLDEI